MKKPWGLQAGYNRARREQAQGFTGSRESLGRGGGTLRVGVWEALAEGRKKGGSVPARHLSAGLEGKNR